MKNTTNVKAPKRRANAVTKTTARLGYPYLSDEELKRRRKEGDARRACMTPDETRAQLIAWGVLNADGTLHRPKMDHVPYGPQE